MIRVAITTLGCKVNQFESAALDNAFAEAGCALVSFRDEADIYVVNTCAVTGRAGQQSRQTIRTALRRNPAARVVVTGCYAQIDPETVRALDPRVLLVGNPDKERLARAALDGVVPEPPPDAERKNKIFNLPIHRFPDHTRAFLRIQDGCDNFCAYCIVPHARGRSRSLPEAEVLAQAARFQAAGFREIVVTGVNAGRYGLDLDEGAGIADILARLCAAFPDIRFRLSSIDPGEIDERLLDTAATHANFMPHFHIPLQSGDDRVLAAMRRRYTAADFAAVVERLRERLPRAAVACDVLAGFPGETDDEAERTREFLWGLPVGALHVFPYSRRPGTPAAAMPGQIAPKVREERARLLRELDARLRRRFYEANLGRVLRVLVERRDRNTGLLEGFSENYIPIRFAGEEALVKRVVPVRLTEIVGDSPGAPLGRLADGPAERTERGA